MEAARAILGGQVVEIGRSHEIRLGIEDRLQKRGVVLLLEGVDDFADDQQLLFVKQAVAYGLRRGPRSCSP
jgi:hypothetical protein